MMPPSYFFPRFDKFPKDNQSSFSQILTGHFVAGTNMFFWLHANSDLFRKGMQNTPVKGSALFLQQCPDKIKQEIMGKWGLGSRPPETSLSPWTHSGRHCVLKKPNQTKTKSVRRETPSCVYLKQSICIKFNNLNRHFLKVFKAKSGLKRSPFQSKAWFFCFPPLHSSFFLSFSTSFLSHSHSWAQLPWKWTINLFPKGIPYATQAWQPQYDACYVVNKQFSWASLPFKGTFPCGRWSCEKCPCQRLACFYPRHKDVRWGELEFPNMLILTSVNSAPFSSTVLQSSFSV